MLTFLNLEAEGFCSIESFHLPLNPTCTILIKAPNGKGKSPILSALVWAIYGKNLKCVSEVNTWKKVRSNDYNGTNLLLFFHYFFYTFYIVICQKQEEALEDGAKGKDRLIFMKDGDIVDIKGKGKIQDFINREIGLSYTLFMN